MKDLYRQGLKVASWAGISWVLAGCDDGAKNVEPVSDEAQSDNSGEVLVARPLRDRGITGESATLFRALSPERSGINPMIQDDPGHPLAYMIGSGMEAGGVAVGDVDGDGLPDLFIASSPGNNRLYRQVGPLKFEDMTPGSGLEHERVWSRGASMVDIDGDGDLDLYVVNYAEKNHLYLNMGKQADGSIRYLEQAKEFGLDLDDACLMPAFCDYDQDGDLDVYVMSNQYHWPDKAKVPALSQMIGNEDGKPVIKHPYDKFYRIKDYKAGENGQLQVRHDITGRPNYLMRNDGGRFKDVTLEAGMKYGHGRGLSPTWWDYNDDGHLDLYVANDWGDRDFLYHNNGDGTFRDAIEDAVPYTSMFTMGSDTGDLNNDGRIDFIAADMSGTTHYKRKVSMGSMQAEQIEFMLKARPPQNMRNAVYLNTGTDRLVEAAYLMGLANSDWSWAVKIADLDNDGFNDVFITNGMEQSIRELEGSAAGETGTELRKEKNLAFRNSGDLKFKDSGEIWGLDHFGYSIAAAHCDFDRDGDLDMFVMHRDEPPVLYENTSKGNGVLIKLEGAAGNREGIGATIKLKTASRTQIRQIILTRGYLTSDEAVAHFGLGKDEKIDALVVSWPDGHEQEFQGLVANHLYTIRASGGGRPVGSSPPKSIFKEDGDFPVVRHTEREFDDFAVQPLLPNKLSQLGPGMAVGDLDGDGDDDLVVGGAAGSETRVLINHEGVPGTPIMIPETARYEDMGLLLVDVDGDGDRDLFAVSGGVESSGADLCDRLYLNDGKGNFSLAPEGVLPKDEASGGPVTAADIDRDGDLDLFVGCRSIPGQYPLAHDSRLLINEGGVFKELPIANLGMVSGATFSDLDGDGWQDLLLAREWGSVAFLKNQSGKLVDQSVEAGLSGLTGWWNGISAADLDGDGDLDIVATNFGLNTKYHASAGHPALLYYGKFGTDAMRLVEAEFEGDQLLPVRGKSCSTQAIPHLAKKFTTFHDFALADMKEIYSKPVIDDSSKFSATNLASGIFINSGKGQFEFRPLPRMAQVAPSFGPVVSDFDGDGIVDLFLAQNFYGPQPETGRMSGGLGILLRGVGGGEFETLGPLESGVSMPDDAKSACLVDFDGNSWPDLLVASNNGPIRSFKNSGVGRRMQVSLEGRGGNLDATGARIVTTLADGSRSVAEVGSGGGYLSQSVSRIFLQSPDAEEAVEFRVYWPDGAESDHRFEKGEAVFKLNQPD